MSDPQAPLRNMPRRHDRLVGIDSDGCAFDTMEIKHKECFIPNIIKHWGLQPVSKFARAASEFVNLYSKWRGENRFPALVLTFDLLRDWPEAMRRNAAIPQVPALRDWIRRETKLGNPALRAEVERTHDPELTRALAWSEAVNAAVEDIVKGVPPFPFVRESLERLQGVADTLVVSATPGEALVREWEEHDIARLVSVIAGQEMGKKAEQLKLAQGGHYGPGSVLMIGDALGDLVAARANCALFFPIVPGREEESW
jgi:phosphoglycolate phosphatase-like HAD superfamily hydrolase